MIAKNIAAMQQEIQDLAAFNHRQPNTIQLIAVTKTQSVDAIRQAIAAGQQHFGENYIKEALSKIEALREYPLTWHFIGPIQSNKTKDIADHFAWVHSVDREKIAVRLNEQRSADLPPLNICLEVNLAGETSKSGIDPENVKALAEIVSRLPRLKLRGLMAIPPHTTDSNVQRQYFKQLRGLFESLCTSGYDLDTLSMGMSDDYPAAIAEGATFIRIGTAIFGVRAKN